MAAAEAMEEAMVPGMEEQMEGAAAVVLEAARATEGAKAAGNAAARMQVCLTLERERERVVVHHHHRHLPRCCAPQAA